MPRKAEGRPGQDTKGDRAAAHQIAIEREEYSGTELASRDDGNDYFTNFCMTQLSHTFVDPETGNLEYGHILKQSKGSTVSKYWILL